MSELSASLGAYFGILGEKAVKERGCFFFKNSKIHKSNSTPRELTTRYNLLKQLDEKGFFHTDLIIPAQNGLPYVSLGRDIFVMTRHVYGQEPDLNNERDVELIVQGLARLHVAARQFSGVEIAKTPPLFETFEKQISMLNSSVKKVNRQPRFSDFDVFILRHADFYIKKMATALEGLSNTNYAVLHANAIKNNHLCHNDLKEESLSICDDMCFFSRFEEVTNDLQLADLALILRRYARKSNREIPIGRFLDIYNKIAPLPTDGEKILHAMLSFPWSFAKIVANFYSKKRNFTPAAITSRMAGVLGEQELYDDYISQGASLG